MTIFGELNTLNCFILIQILICEMFLDGGDPGQIVGAAGMGSEQVPKRLTSEDAKGHGSRRLDGMFHLCLLYTSRCV